ncbi:hypothetical protein [Saccharopolyspora taberi]|uniref:ABC transporter permease n=1 Tax=Saccharopolyspora taberi TaxID=60895 RepID=A0ABN3VN04_9PSEU
MITRAMGRELLRGSGWPLAVVVLAGVAAVLLGDPLWAGNWGELAVGVRTSLMFVVPVAAMTGTWVSGRALRRGTAELLAISPRPRWQPLVASWAGLTAGASLGLLAAWAAAGALVVPIATHGSAAWVGMLLGCVPILAAATAFGLAFGHVVTWRLAAPLCGIVAGLAVVAFQWGAHDAYLVLSPLLLTARSVGTVYPDEINALQALWFAALTAALLGMVSFRRKLLALVPTALAVAAAGALVLNAPHWEPDPVAQEQVCVTNGGTVCGPRVQEHVYPEVAALAQPMLDKLRGIPGAPTQVTYGGSEGMSLHETTPTGALADPEFERTALANDLVSGNYTCQDPAFMTGRPIASGLLLGDQQPDRNWLTSYYAALNTCDAEGMRALLR